MADPAIKKVPFSSINLLDPFFESLRMNYPDFKEWFRKKAMEKAEAYVVSTRQGISGFLYLKQEICPITDINPPLLAERCLKIGTFKVDSHGTKLGERFVKLIIDQVIKQKLRYAYVTIFPEHEPLIRILEGFGFCKWSEKHGKRRTEHVYIKDIYACTGNILSDYPVMDLRRADKWLVSIRPEFHSELFPDSILRTESAEIIQDLSHTNSIHKVYLGFAQKWPEVVQGSCLVIYRCQDKEGTHAWFKSVATSLCLVEEVRPKRSFLSEQDFINYCQKYSVFTEEKLRTVFRARKKFELHAIKMTYNLALPKRPNLEQLVTEGVLPHPKEKKEYLGLKKLSEAEFQAIVTLGNVDARLIIN